MRVFSFVLASALSASTTFAFADIEECRKIEDATLRLKCFDGLPASTVPTPKRKPSTQSVLPSPDIGWQLQKRKDAMTDRTSCVVYPSNKHYVQFSPGHLYISYHGRGGVQGFRFRIDEAPPSDMQLPTQIERQISAVHISGSTLDRILSAQRLRVEVLTMVSGIQNEDLKLTGLRQQYDKMIQECR